MIRTGSTDSLFYICTDHLGSITALVNENGTLVERHSYDAWGRERDPNDWSSYTVAAGILDRGYSSHEQLREFGLINMNGRVYDPILGRMLSPDNDVQNPFDSQNLNRYTYCLNNPLLYTDPTGNTVLSQFFGWVKKNTWDAMWNFLNGPGGVSDFLHNVGVPNFSVGYNTSLGPNYSIGNNPTVYPDYQNKTDAMLTKTATYLQGVQDYCSGMIQDSRASKNEKTDQFNTWFTNSTTNLGANASGQGGSSTLDNLSNVGSVASYGVSIAEIGGYNATVGVWGDLSKVRYYSSGWSGSNQYVWNTFGVAQSLGYVFYTGGTVLNLSSYYAGEQSGLETGLNVGVSTGSLIVGGTAGIGVSGGYEYLKYMWNTIIDYGSSVNRLYRDTYLQYFQGTPYEISGQ